jgi:hypothetical protein
LSVSLVCITENLLQVNGLKMDYIVCRRKKSRPKTSVGVCERCSRKRSCQDYRAYLQPSLFPKFALKKPEKRASRRSAKPSKDAPVRKEEQMPFILTVFLIPVLLGFYSLLMVA